MTDIKILTISDYVLKFIQTDHKSSVHSVYKNTVNLISDGQLTALQTRNSITSPISVITSLERFNLNVKIGDPCELTKSKIFFPLSDLTFSITDNTEIFDSEIPILTNFNGEYLKQKAENMINSVNVSGFAGIFQNKKSDNPILIAAEKFIAAAENHALNENWKGTAEILCSLIGLGEGLTPSGDDFLCGVITGIRYLFPFGHELKFELENLMPSKLNRTNDISKAFLLCALQGRTSSAVKLFFENGECLNEFLSVGHSSGIDTLCGINFALYVSDYTSKL